MRGMSRLTSDEIERLAEAFDDYHHEKYPETRPSVENRLTSLLTNQNYLTTSDVADALEWKLEGQGGRFERYKSQLESVPPDYVELVTEAAFMLDETQQQMKTLYAIPGVGYATATVLMSFNNPADYAVGDRYINEVILGLEDTQITLSNYGYLLDELRKRNPDDFDLRTVEKAYYQDHLERIHEE